jgi:hypothetical protein
MRLDEYRRGPRVAGREGDDLRSHKLQAKAISDVSGSKLKGPILEKIFERIRNNESGGIIVNDVGRYPRCVLRCAHPMHLAWIRQP